MSRSQRVVMFSEISVNITSLILQGDGPLANRKKITKTTGGIKIGLN